MGRRGDEDGAGLVEGSGLGFVLLGEQGVLRYLAERPELADRLGGADTCGGWKVGSTCTHVPGFSAYG